MAHAPFVHVALMGAQGSGKGTQAARLTPRYGLVHLSTGDLFRAAIASGSAVGQEIKTIYDRGDLIPDDLTLRLVALRLDELAAQASAGAGIAGALFDGFPRTAAQAEGLDGLLARRGERLAGVVLITVPLEALVVRLAGRRVCPRDGKTYHVEFDPPQVAGVCDLCQSPLVQREDDQPVAIKRRLDNFFAQTAPLVDYYRERGVLVEVSGNQPVDRVTGAIERALSRMGVVPIGDTGATE